MSTADTAGKMETRFLTERASDTACQASGAPDAADVACEQPEQEHIV